MSISEYPNRDALIGALRVYVKTMYPFIRKCLGEQEIEEFLRLPSDSNIEEKIEVKDISRIINERDYWRDYFQEKFKIIDRDDIRYYDARSVTRLIMIGRNQVSHDELRELDPEFTRTQLFLIAELLGKVNRPDKQREVETIRDDLFADDTAERLADAEERLKDVETENAKYQKSLEKSKKDLETEESEKIEYKQENERLSEESEQKEKRLKKLSRQLKNARAETEKNKKNLADTKKRLEKSEAVQADYKDYKERLRKQSKELKDTKNELASVKVEKNISEKYLTVTRNLLTTVAIGDQAVFPPFGTDSAVRVLDRRGTDKRNYLLGLLEQKLPTIVYVQSEEKIEQLLALVGSEKAAVIAKHNDQTSEAEETEIFEKLERGELVAIVSDTTFSTSIPSHCIEHFIFCHLAPSSDAFFDRCRPAFTPTNNAYLHLIYESKQNVEELVEKYPNEEALRKLYQKFRDLTSIDGKFIDPGNLYSELSKEGELDMTILGIETGFSIFEELGFLEQNEEGIRRLSTTPTKLDISEIYCRGEKLKKEIANSPDFQYEQSIEQIWEEILEKLNIDDKQILRESSAHKIPLRISETEGDYLKDSQTQPEQPIEVVEKDSTASDEIAEADHTPRPPRAHAKVTEEQVPLRENRTEEAKSTKTKSSGKKPSIAERYVAETTVEDRDGIAAQVVELRINVTGSKPLSWRKIREKLGLKNDQFHKVIRPSEGYRKAVIQRIKSLKAQDGGWKYNGKLEVLTGIELTEKELE